MNVELPSVPGPTYHFQTYSYDMLTSNQLPPVSYPLPLPLPLPC
jgi:hypothetical protein